MKRIPCLLLALALCGLTGCAQHPADSVYYAKSYFILCPPPFFGGTGA